MSSKSDRDEEKAFERLRKEFPKSDVSLEKRWCSWNKGLEAKYYAYASKHDDKLYENAGLITSNRLTADEAVDTLIEIREEEKKARIEGEKKEGTL